MALMTFVVSSLLALGTTTSAFRMTIVPRVCQSPCTVTVTVLLDEDDRHRGMSVMWADGATYRQLEGKASVRAWTFDVLVSSRGQQAIDVHVYDTNGFHEGRRQTVDVVGEGELRTECRLRLQSLPH